MYLNGNNRGEEVLTASLSFIQTLTKEYSASILEKQVKLGRETIRLTHKRSSVYHNGICLLPIPHTAGVQNLHISLIAKGDDLTFRSSELLKDRINLQQYFIKLHAFKDFRTMRNHMPNELLNTMNFNGIDLLKSIEPIEGLPNTPQFEIILFYYTKSLSF